MPNPLDLRGPEFLIFYAGLGAVVAVVIAALRRLADPATPGTVALTDYLKIAYLRGGPREALRVAALSLMDRGLVEVVDDDCLKATSAKRPSGLQQTEDRLLDSCKAPTRASEI